MTQFETGLNFFGMMNCGKTKIGGIIAARYDLKFVDTDVLVTQEEGRSPADIIKADGAARFMALQRQIILDQDRDRVEIWATGGSVAKDTEVVKHLRRFGVGVFLFVHPDIVETRTTEDERLALANPNGLSFRDLYLVERMPFYAAAADVIVKVDDPNQAAETTADQVIASVASYK